MWALLGREIKLIQKNACLQMRKKAILSTQIFVKSIWIVENIKKMQ